MSLSWVVFYTQDQKQKVDSRRDAIIFSCCARRRDLWSIAPFHHDIKLPLSQQQISPFCFIILLQIHNRAKVEPPCRCRVSLRPRRIQTWLITPSHDSQRATLWYSPSKCGRDFSPDVPASVCLSLSVTAVTSWQRSLFLIRTARWALKQARFKAAHYIRYTARRRSRAFARVSWAARTPSEWHRAPLLLKTDPEAERKWMMRYAVIIIQWQFTFD